MRQDARRNLERVFAAAKLCFAEAGADTSMEAIARHAGVGVGTLYRRFGSRAGLVEALYADALEQIGREATDLAGHPDPWKALARWCAAYVELLATKRTMLAELRPWLNAHPEQLEAQRHSARKVLGGFLDRAQAAGVARLAVDAADVIALLNASMTSGDGARLLAIVLEGIRRRDEA